MSELWSTEGPSKEEKTYREYMNVPLVIKVLAWMKGGGASETTVVDIVGIHTETHF